MVNLVHPEVGCILKTTDPVFDFSIRESLSVYAYNRLRPTVQYQNICSRNIPSSIVAQVKYNTIIIKYFAWT